MKWHVCQLPSKCALNICLFDKDLVSKIFYWKVKGTEILPGLMLKLFTCWGTLPMGAPEDFGEIQIFANLCLILVICPQNMADAIYTTWFGSGVMNLPSGRFLLVSGHLVQTRY